MSSEERESGVARLDDEAPPEIPALDDEAPPDVPDLDEPAISGPSGADESEQVDADRRLKPPPKPKSPDELDADDEKLPPPRRRAPTMPDIPQEEARAAQAILDSGILSNPDAASKPSPPRPAPKSQSGDSEPPSLQGMRIISVGPAEPDASSDATPPPAPAAAPPPRPAPVSKAKLSPPPKPAVANGSASTASAGTVSASPSDEEAPPEIPGFEGAVPGLLADDDTEDEEEEVEEVEPIPSSPPGALPSPTTSDATPPPPPSAIKSDTAPVPSAPPPPSAIKSGLASLPPTPTPESNSPPPAVKSDQAAAPSTPQASQAASRPPRPGAKASVPPRPKTKSEPAPPRPAKAKRESLPPRPDSKSDPAPPRPLLKSDPAPPPRPPLKSEPAPPRPPLKGDPTPSSPPVDSSPPGSRPTPIQSVPPVAALLSSAELSAAEELPAEDLAEPATAEGADPTEETTGEDGEPSAASERRPPPPPKRPPPPAPSTRSDDSERRSTRRPWWEEAFRDDFTRADAPLSTQQVKAEVDFIEESLGVAAGGVVLDLCCGAGHHAVELSSRGYGVVGYDLSLYQLALAAEVAQDKNQKINFLQGDVREMAFEEMFDGMYCWNTSFGYFEEEKNLSVAERMFKALRSGGMLLLDVINRDFVVQQTPNSVWYEGDSAVCMDDMSVDFITSRLRVKRQLMLDDGRQKEINFSVRLYSLHELGKLLHDVGFRVTEASGHLAHPGVFFGAQSPRIIILAQKP